jgi:hypothetical protein
VWVPLGRSDEGWSFMGSEHARRVVFERGFFTHHATPREANA